MKRSKGIGTLLVAMLLVSMALVPSVSAAEDTADTDAGNVSIQSLSTTATLTVTPQTGDLNTVFFFDAEATYEADIYGIPIPGGLQFDHDISYIAFHDPVVTGSSWANADFVYKANSPIGESWNFYKYWLSIGGPTTKYIDSHTWPKTTGSYNNQLFAAIGLISSDTDTKTVLIS